MTRSQSSLHAQCIYFDDIETPCQVPATVTVTLTHTDEVRRACRRHASRAQNYGPPATYRCDQ